jgi:hypothetical protein
MKFRQKQSGESIAGNLIPSHESYFIQYRAHELEMNGDCPEIPSLPWLCLPVLCELGSFFAR